MHPDPLPRPHPPLIRPRPMQEKNLSQQRREDFVASIHKMEVSNCCNTSKDFRIIDGNVFVSAAGKSSLHSL